MKVLVIAAHPDLATSRVCRRWLEDLRERSQVTVRDLAVNYPDGVIDVPNEQALLLQHDRYVLLFPLYWYSAPALLKHWMDQVLLPGFAYAVGGDKLHGKQWVICTSVGSSERAYRAGGYNHFTLDELLRPLQQSVTYTGGIYLPPFSMFKSIVASDEDIARNSARLQEYVLGDFNPVREHDQLVTDSMGVLQQRYMQAAELAEPVAGSKMYA